MTLAIVAAWAALGALLGLGSIYLTPAIEKLCSITEPPLSPLPKWITLTLTTPLFALLAWHQGLNQDLFIYSLWLWLLIFLAIFDWRHRLILDVLIYPAIILALVLAPFTSQVGVPAALLGLAANAAILVPLGLVSELTSQGLGFGWGDVKLGALIGAIFGFSLTYWHFYGLTALCLGLIAGGVISGILLLARILKPHQAIAYGPFLALGAIIMLFVI